jgi:hypothetical protein
MEPSAPLLPVHILTIVLNGEPFIRYHLDVFRRLPFRWHWHVVEGVAELKNDTAWSLAQGGRVTAGCHARGRSSDGTAEYLDDIAGRFPENVTVYRKPPGVFWDGKREMVNAPLQNVREECLLWQVDADELWTAEQLINTNRLFAAHPRRRAAYYWCRYFVGPDLVISTRNCYAQNPAQEWLRTWRFRPGCRFAAHEPPRLVEKRNGKPIDVASLEAFLHDETEKHGLVFQHFAYVTLAQLQFKEEYYGYRHAIADWLALQAQTQWPVPLARFFSWVRDGTLVDRAAACGVTPLARKGARGDTWQFHSGEAGRDQPEPAPAPLPRVVVDGIVFQLQGHALSAVWRQVLGQWAETDFARHVVVLDRGGTAPRFGPLTYRTTPRYDRSRAAVDARIVQYLCDEEGADLFVSSYYSSPIDTPSVVLALEPPGKDEGVDETLVPSQDKRYGLYHASACLASGDAAASLRRSLPHLPPGAVREITGVNSLSGLAQVLAQILVETFADIVKGKLALPSPIWSEFRQMQQVLQQLQNPAPTALNPPGKLHYLRSASRMIGQAMGLIRRPYASAGML